MRSLGTAGAGRGYTADAVGKPGRDVSGRRVHFGVTVVRTFESR